MKRTMPLRLALVGLLVGTSPALARSETANSPDAGLIEQMKSEGWEAIAGGLLQRRLGAYTVETFAHGVDGLTAFVALQEAGLERLVEQQSSRPTEDAEELSRAIEDSERRVEDTRLLLEMLRAAPPADLGILAQSSGCDVQYGASADAYSLVTTQGVAATASAHFWNNCGYLATTYAYAHAEASQGRGIPKLVVTQTDEKVDRTNATSSASASATGVSPCYAKAVGRVTSSDLGILFERTSEVNVCPEPPTVTISGPTDVYFSSWWDCHQETWTAQVSGGTPGYSYLWEHLTTGQWGTDSSFAVWYCADAYATSDWWDTLKLTVEDSGGMTDSDQIVIHVHSLCEPTPPFWFC